MSVQQSVREAIQEHALVQSGETIVVGVSGGPDSLVLLHVLRELAPSLGIDLHVAHLDHQLRGAESQADAAFVAELARNWDLPASAEARPVAAYARRHKLSLEEGARIVRYRFLAETAARIGSHTVAVAHNADDQAETVLMHFIRGSGLAGLRGMLYKSPLPAEFTVQNSEFEIQLIRPLLDVPRAEIEAYCREYNLEPRFDRSNLETTAFRNRLRHEVIPYLERFNPNLRAVLRHTARGVADDYEYLHGQAATAFDTVAHPVQRSIVFNRALWRDLPPGLQRATLREAIRRLRSGLRNINWVHIDEARRVALQGTVGAQATLPQELMLTIGYADFTIGETLPRPDWPFLFDDALFLHPDHTFPLPGADWVIRVTSAARDHNQPAPDGPPGQALAESAPNPVQPAGERSARSRWIAEVDEDKIHGELVLRVRQPGDRFQPSGLGGHVKTLHDFMINEKIPAHLRDLLPLLADNEKILWVSGYRLDERARVTGATARVLRVEFSKQDPQE